MICIELTRGYSSWLKGRILLGNSIIPTLYSMEKIVKDTSVDLHFLIVC